jgi:hypothetical protein
LEDYFIRQFVTAYPFGLNDKIDKYGNVSEIRSEHKSKNSPYFTCKTPRRKRSHGIKGKKHQKIANEAILEQFVQKFQLFNINTTANCRVYQWLRSLKHKEITEFFAYLNNLKNKFSYTLIIRTISAFLSSKGVLAIKHQPRPKPQYFKIPFINKAMQWLKFENLLQHSHIRNALPPDTCKTFLNYRTTYKYEAPLCLEICNYGTFLTKLDNKQLIETLQSTCECHNNPFIYTKCGHIITGDLSFIQDQELRHLMEKGAKFRKPMEIKYPETQTKAAVSIFEYFRQISTKTNTPMNDMLPALQQAYRILNIRIRNLKNQQNNHSHVNKREQHTASLSNLHKKFIIAPADKAGNNFVFICKKHYCLILCEELGVEYSNNSLRARGNLTYKPFIIYKEFLFDLHQALGSKFNLILKEEDRKIPKLFAIPKLHKNPYKFRFIAGATFSSNKPLSLHLLTFLLALKNHFKNYSLKKGHEMKINLYWSIENTQGALEMLDKVHKPNNLITADFSTLFTALPHDTIMNCLNNIIDICFQNAGKPYLGVSKSKFSKYYEYNQYKNNKSYHWISSADFKTLISTVLKENYVRFADFQFRQDTGIPMGNPASPVLADLTLTGLEYFFLTNPINRSEAYKCRNVVRYIDDLLSTNNPLFNRIASKIYPDEIPLNFTELSDKSIQFLDCEISVDVDSKLKYISIYDKTRDFNFQVKKFIHSSSNVHDNLFSNVFMSQIIRVARICNNRNKFKLEIRRLIKDMQFNLVDESALYNTYFEVYQNYNQLFQKFGISTKLASVSFLVGCLHSA